MDIFVSLIFILNFILEIVNSHDKLTKLDQFEIIRISNFSGLACSQINFQNFHVEVKFSHNLLIRRVELRSGNLIFWSIEKKLCWEFEKNSWARISIMNIILPKYALSKFHQRYCYYNIVLFLWKENAFSRNLTGKVHFTEPTFFKSHLKILF